MENEIKKGKKKIEIKLIESERACVVSFSKRKKTLFQDASKFTARTGADVGVMLVSPGGKPCSYCSTSIDEIIDKFFKVKLEDHQRDYVEGKSNDFEALENLHKELQACNEKDEKCILMHKIMHPSSEVPPNQHMKEQKLAWKLRVEKIKKETQSFILVEHQNFDLNVAPEPEEDEES
ncbi:hypothetical protein RDI58_007441 [Solanum bulbocastanum]|uniref:MADS-box domain-containing protein n=1 Tax=Solanum bulbocastanum TaxID=147425 RepID=A0AAN8U0A0_SOLBU